MESSYIQTGLGILVSILLFLMGYRQTIGAKKERIRAANGKLIDVILKRIILEKYTPQKNEIKRLVEGVARDYKINYEELLNIDQILNTLYTRIFENDLISKEQREENLERLSCLFTIKGECKQHEVYQMLALNENKRKKDWNNIVLILGTASALLGTFLTSFNSILNNLTDDLYTILLSVIASLFAIIVTYSFLRLKGNQENDNETVSKSFFSDAVKFEERVIHDLKKRKSDIYISNQEDCYWDFVIVINSEQIAVEMKYWKNRPPLALIKKTMLNMKDSMEKKEIHRGFLLVNNAFGLNEKIGDDNIKILTLNDLLKLL